MLTNLCRSQLNDRNNDFPFHRDLTEKKDCNVAQVSQAIELVTGEKKNAEEIRVLGQEPKGPTGNTFARLAFEGLFLTPEVDYRMLWAAPIQTVRDLLMAGWYVVLYVDYGVLNKVAPSISGDKNFIGSPGHPAYHAIGLSDWWRGKLGASVHYHDPLNDGRHKNTPKGVQVAKFSWIRDAAYGYSKRPGIVQGYAVKPRSTEPPLL